MPRGVILSGKCFWPPSLPRQKRLNQGPRDTTPVYAVAVTACPRRMRVWHRCALPEEAAAAGTNHPGSMECTSCTDQLQLISPLRAKDIAGLACDAGRLAPSLNTITRWNAACRLGLCRRRRVVTGSTPPVTTRARSHGMRRHTSQHRTRGDDTGDSEAHALAAAAMASHRWHFC